MLISLLAPCLLQTAVPTLTPIPDPVFHSPESLELVRIVSILRVSGSRVLVTDQDGQTVFLLDSTGKVLPPLAGKGEGPGEVKGATTIGWLKDTLWITDRILRRITYFSPTLKFVRSDRDMERCGFQPWAIAPDGRCLAVPQGYVPRNKPFPDSLPLVATRPKAATDTLGWWVLPRMVIRYADAESHITQPFADDPVPAIASNGRFMAWVGGRRIRPDGPPAASIVTHDFDGGVRYRFSVEFTPQPLPRDTVSRVLAKYRKNQAPWPTPGQNDSIARRLYRPQFLPAFAGSLLDDNGRLWLKEQAPQGSLTVTWRVYLLDGTPAFNVHLPAGVKLTSVAGSVLLGFTIDDDDVPTIVQYRLPAGLPVWAASGHP